MPRHEKKQGDAASCRVMENEEMEEGRKEPVRLMEIERELAGPDKDAALSRYDAILAALDRRIKAAMDAGLAPEEFSRVESLQEANTTARKILRLAVRVDG